MPEGVRFQEDSVPIPKVKPRSAENGFTSFGMTLNSTQAQIVLGFVAMSAIVGSIYFIVSAVPPLPELGEDEPRPGEVIPSNRTL